MAHDDIAAISNVERRIWQQAIRAAVNNTWAAVKSHLPENQRDEAGPVFQLLNEIYILAGKAPNEQQFQALEQSLKEASAIIESTRSAAQDWRSQRNAAIEELHDLLHDLRRGHIRHPDVRAFFEQEAAQMRDMAFEIMPDRWQQDFGWSHDESRALFDGLNCDPSMMQEPDYHYGYTADDIQTFRAELRELVNTYLIQKESDTS